MIGLSSIVGVVGGLISSSYSSDQNLLISNRNREAQAEENRKNREAQAKENKKNREAQAEENQKNRNWQREQQQLDQTFREKQSEIERKFKEEMVKAEHEHSLKIQAIAHENTKELQQISHQYQLEVQARQHRHDKEMFELQKEQALQMQLAKQEYERESAILNHQRNWTTLQSQIQLQEMMKYWPLTVMPDQLLLKYNPEFRSIIPVTVFMINTLNPPNNDFDNHLATDLKDFIRLFNDNTRPVEFMDKGWKKVPGGGASIKVLQSFLSSMPTLILEAEFISNEDDATEKDLLFNINFGYWGLDEVEYSYRPLLSKLSCKSFDNNNSKIRSFISLCFKLILGICSDAHYIKHYALAPFLPQLIKEVAKDLNYEDSILIVKELVQEYCQALEKLGQETNYLVPQWQMAMAKEVTFIPGLASLVADKAVENWFKTRR